MKNMSQWFPRAYLCSNLGRTPATQNFCQLLSFGCDFLKFHSILCFVFFFKSNRVLLNPVFKPPVLGACGAPILTVVAGGGGPQLAVPPGPRFHQSLSSVSSVSRLLLSTGK